MPHFSRPLREVGIFVRLQCCQPANARTLGYQNHYGNHIPRSPLKFVPAIADSKYMDPSSIALQGLQQADTQLDAAASAIASAGATSANGSNPDVVDLSTEMVALMSAQNSFSANLATLKTADEMQKTLLDVTA